MDTPAFLYDIMIDDAELSVRSTNALKAAGWENMGDVYDITVAGIYNVKNIGRRGAAEVIEVLDGLIRSHTPQAAGTVTVNIPDGYVITVHRPGHVMVPAEVEYDDSLNRLGWVAWDWIRKGNTNMPKPFLKEIIEQWIKDHEVGK